jgi:transcriptional regulator with XRE-family HTH domain
MDEERMTYALDLAGLLIERRAELHIRSQHDLAAMVGVSEATVRRWEAGSHVPDAFSLRRLTTALAVSAEQILYPQHLSTREREIMRRATRRIHMARDPDPEGD